MLYKKILRRTLNGVLFLSLLLLLVALFTPYLCNRYLLPRLGEKLPFSQQSLQIDSLSPWKLTAKLKVRAEKNSLSLPRLELHYNFFKLLRGEVEQVVISGLVIDLHGDKGRFVFTRPASGKREQQGGPEETAGKTMRIKKILLQECRVHIEDSAKNLRGSTMIDGELSSLSFPLSSARQKLAGSISVKGMGLSAMLDFVVDFSGKKRQAHLELKLPQGSVLRTCPAIPFQFSGHGTVTADIEFDQLYALQHYQASLRLFAARFRSKNLAVVSRREQPVVARIEGDQAQASFSVKNLHSIAPEKLTADISGEIDFPAARVAGRALIDTVYSVAPLAFNFTVKQKDGFSHIATTLAGEELRIKNISLPQLSMEAAAVVKAGKATGAIRLAVPEIALPQLRMAKAELSLPFRFPPQRGEAGSFSLAAIRYKKRDLGKITGRLRQSAAGMNTTLWLKSPLFTGSQLKCKAEIAAIPLQITAECHLPWADFTSTSLPALVKSNPALSFSGKIGAKGRITAAGGRMTGSASLAVKDGSLFQEKTALTGIHGAVTLPDINYIRSSPDQRLAIGRITSGNISADNAEIRWQLEDPRTLFIEKAQLNWCGGKVEAASLRLSADKKELATTLYCDRLLLNELLAQFDLAQTAGEASLNGRLPVVLSGRGIEIDSGFLFSTPGEQGVLSFANTRQIRDSIPGMATSPYIEYSLESLKNFAYNWVKLTLDSDKGDMLVKMQLDGKPAAPLPYRYKNGRIVPLPAGEGGQAGLQHPVRFDVNFHLPLRQMFRYGTGMQSVINNFKESF